MSPFRFVKWIAQGQRVTVYGDGQQSRDFTYVDDIARGTIAALKPVGYEVVNLGSDQPIVLMDLIRLVEQKLGKRSLIKHQPANPADMPRTWANIGKAQRLLGWRPEISFDEGIGRLVDWYRDNEGWAGQIQI